MDRIEYSTLLDYLTKVPDSRQARGKRYDWEFLLTIIAMGIVSSQKTAWAIACWAKEQAEVILERLQASTIPSPSTLYRALRYIDIEALEAQVAAYGQAIDDVEALAPRQQITAETPEEREAVEQPSWQGQAVDGKEIRGARAHGMPVHLLSLVRHGQGTILGQQRLAAGAGEFSTLPRLLAGRDLSGTVTTFDAAFTYPEMAQQVLEQGGDYFMLVKANQPSLLEAIATLFSEPAAPGEKRWQDVSWSKGHGRLEQRTVVSSEVLNAYLDWPGVGQVVQRTCLRIRAGERSQETKYAITSLRHREASAAELGGLWRGHWTIENRSHYVRDETMGEDRGQAHKGHTAQALAALRNAVLTAFRHEGWANIANALRHYSTPERSLRFIGAIVA